MEYVPDPANPDLGCNWKITNLLTHDRMLNVSSYSHTREAKSAYNPLRVSDNGGHAKDIVLAPPAGSEHYVNGDICITHGANKSYVFINIRT